MCWNKEIYIWPSMHPSLTAFHQAPGHGANQRIDQWIEDLRSFHWKKTELRYNSWWRFDPAPVESGSSCCCCCCCCCCCSSHDLQGFSNAKFAIAMAATAVPWSKFSRAKPFAWRWRCHRRKGSSMLCSASWPQPQPKACHQKWRDVYLWISDRHCASNSFWPSKVPGAYFVKWCKIARFFL